MQDRVAPSLLGRVASVGAVIGLIGLAVLALLSGSDRQSREFPASPSLVGWPYDTGAARAKALVAFIRTGPSSAIGYARRAIVSDPLSIQAISSLGRSQLYAGQPDEARKTFIVAGQLGWRDQMTEMYWLDQSLQVGDYKVAAQRLDALLRQSPNDENRDKFLAIVSATPDSRAALAERLKLSPNWAKTYLSEAGRLSGEEVTQRVDLLRRTGRGVWDCRETVGIAQKLIELVKLDEAQSVWRLNCASSSSLVYDGQFDQIDTIHPSSGFDWQLSIRGDADIAPMQDPSGNRSLTLEVNAPISLPIVRQLVVLKPGRYRLTWRTPGTPASQAQALRVSLTCKPDLSLAAQGAPVANQTETWASEFVVDAQCSARPLIFWLSPKVSVSLDDVALEPL